MEYGDEKIVKLMHQYKKGVSGEIETGLYVREVLYHFERKAIVDSNISIMVPLQFQRSSKEQVEEQYGKDVATEHYYKMDNSVELLFQKIRMREDENKTISSEGILKDFKDKLKKLNPDIKIIEEKQLQTDNIEVTWLDYQSITILKKIVTIQEPLIQK